MFKRRSDKKADLFTDGGARGNPGPAGVGFVIKNELGEVIASGGRYVGKATNNVAEYLAFIFGLEEALSMSIDAVACYSDSELIVKQLNGEYRVKEPSLKGHYLKARGLMRRFAEITLEAVPRKKNESADRLVNQALDEAGY